MNANPQETMGCDWFLGMLSEEVIAPPSSKALVGFPIDYFYCYLEKA